MTEELTQEQIDRLDFVHNRIHQMMCDLAGQEIDWNMEWIGEISDLAEHFICKELGLMTDMEFAPYIVHELEPTEGGITPEMVRGYLGGGWSKCLFCGNDDPSKGDIEGGPVEIDGNLAWQDVTCHACDKSWRDCYTLTGVLPLE